MPERSFTAASVPVPRQPPPVGPSPVPTVTLGEYAQAKIRCWMNLVLITLALVAYRYQPSISLQTIWYTFVFTAVSAGTLLWWARAVSRLPANSRSRIAQRIASVLLDNVSISWILYFGGESLAGIFSVYLWITIGYGTRFGLRYLYANLATSLVSFAIVASLSPFWRNYAALSFGLGMGLLVVPLYAAYLISQLHEAVRRAESASTAKGDFLAKMSHELRTPLHGIIALADLLGATESPAQKQEMIRQIGVSSNALLDLINRILDISKYESGKFALQSEDMDLHAVVDDTVSILSPQAKAKGIRISAFFDTDVENRLVGSPRQLQEVLINLAGNALKFTENGKVQVSVIRAGGADGREALRLIISDTGPGIQKEYLQWIFDPFSQADDSVTRQHGGTGLGTTIARDLVHLMDGHISIDSELGVGSTVTIELNLAHAKTSIEPLAHALRVAVIGDSARMQALVAALESLGVSEIREAALADLPWLADYCVFVDLESRAAATLFEHESALSEPQTRMPVIGVGPTASRDLAIDLAMLTFVPDTPSLKSLRRALDLAHLMLSRATEVIEPKVAGNGYSVLVAEDNSTNQMIARIALERAGYDCTIVDDGEKALDELSTQRYDIALIDMHMPVMDGLEVARLYNFASFDEAARTPIIMVTADNRPDVVADADFAGISRFVVKPIKPSMLLRVVHDLLQDSNATPTSESTSPDCAEVRVIVPEEQSEPLLDLVILGELLSYMDTAEAKQFFDEFRQDAHAYINTLRLIGQHDSAFSKVRDDMHALCGAARTIGAVELAAIARRVEYSKEEEVRSRPGALVVELDDALAVVLDLIEQRLGAAA
jgi:two-component system sensor histidine kinase RpfC